MDNPNYCSKEEAAQIRGIEALAVTVQQWWLDAVDSLIEGHTGQGFKGASRTTSLNGWGNTYLRLPSRAGYINRVTENDREMTLGVEYKLETAGVLLKRLSSNWPYTGAGRWLRGCEYIVEYQEPLNVPMEYKLVAANCVAMVMMFAKKHKEFDMALSAHDGASAGKVASQESTTFPASLMTEINRALRDTLKKKYI